MKHWLRVIIVGAGNGIVLSIAGVHAYPQPWKFFGLCFGLVVLENIGLASKEEHRS